MSAFTLLHEPALPFVVAEVNKSSSRSPALTVAKKNYCSHARLSAARKLARAKEGMPVRRGLGFFEYPV